MKKPHQGLTEYMEDWLVDLAISGCIAGLVSLNVVQAKEQTFDARLIGKIGQVTNPETVWIGALEVRLRAPFVSEDQRASALEFMKALAFEGREVECGLTGERTQPSDGGHLVGDCAVFGPTDGREIDLGGRLIERGFARPCTEPGAMIAIWPPVFVCE